MMLELQQKGVLFCKEACNYMKNKTIPAAATLTCSYRTSEECADRAYVILMCEDMVGSMPFLVHRCC